jgi:DNA-binding transcriptional LysR family regulator
MNYTLDQLLALEAIHRLGSFAAAAKSLFRATSAVSYSIKSLETALDVTLFDRGGHRAVLTPAGELVLAEAQRVIGQARRLEQVALELNRGHEPLLPIVLDGILPQPPVMAAMRAFVDRQLPTRVQLVVEYLTGVVERFRESEAAIMLVLDYEGDQELSAIPLPKVDMFLLAHRDHALNQTGQSVDRAELARHVELVVADSSQRSSGASHRLFLGSPHLFELSDFHSKRQALLGGVGYGWLPNHLAAPHMKSGELVTIPFEEGSVHTFDPHLVYRKDPPLGAAGRLFMELFLKEAGVAPAALAVA